MRHKFFPVNKGDLLVIECVFCMFVQSLPSLLLLFISDKPGLHNSLEKDDGEFLRYILS